MENLSKEEIRMANRYFKTEKRKVAKILAEGGNFPNDGKIDPEIHDLVYGINRLPFAYTKGSCSGHFVTREDVIKKHQGTEEKKLRLPKEGFGFYFDGNLWIACNYSEKAEHYISGIRRIIRDYPNASIDDWPRSEFLIKLDNLQKKWPVLLSIEEGLERRSIVKGLIKELAEISSEY